MKKTWKTKQEPEGEPRKHPEVVQKTEDEVGRGSPLLCDATDVEDLPQ